MAPSPNVFGLCCCVCSVPHGAWSMFTFGVCGGAPGAGPLGGGTAKETGPRWGGCGKAHHERKVLGAAGASAPMHLQEGSREPEDAVLWNLTRGFPWVSVTGFQSCSQTAQALAYLQGVRCTLSVSNSYQCLQRFLRISFSQCCLSLLSPAATMDLSPPPGSYNGLQLSWFGRGSRPPGAALDVWYLPPQTLAWLLMCIAHRALLTRETSHVFSLAPLYSQSQQLPDCFLAFVCPKLLCLEWALISTSFSEKEWLQNKPRVISLPLRPGDVLAFKSGSINFKP